MITGPLRDRFGFVARLDYYEPVELVAIVERAAVILGVPLDGRGRARDRAAGREARRASPTGCSSGCVTTPRSAPTAVSTPTRRARRSPCSRSTSSASTRSTGRSCTRCARPSPVGAVGLGTLAVSVAEEPETVEDVYEPFLLKQGLLLRTPRGRVATSAAFAHLGVAPPVRAVTARALRRLNEHHGRAPLPSPAGRGAGHAHGRHHLPGHPRRGLLLPHRAAPAAAHGRAPGTDGEPRGGRRDRHLGRVARHDPRAG